MHKGKIVFSLLGPTNQQTAESVQPAVCSLNHPAPGAVALFTNVALRFATAAQVSGKAQARHQLAHLVKVIALVQAQTLGILRRRLWALHHQSIEGLLCQFHVVPVGSIHHDGQRYAVRLGQ